MVSEPTIDVRVCVYVCVCYLLPRRCFKRMLSRVAYQLCDILVLSALIDSIYLHAAPLI